MTDNTPVLYRGLDAADIDGMVRNATRIKAAGLDFVLTYLKWTTPAHIAALHKAGLAIGLIFEAGTQNSLGGASQGAVDGERARLQAGALNSPASVPIFAAVDTGVGAQVAVSDYFASFKTDAAYADGELLRVLDLKHRWLAGAMGWPGSRDYYANGPWDLVQGTPMRGGHQLGMDWPNLGFEYDPDVARNLDWAWQPPSAVVTDRPTAAQQPASPAYPAPGVVAIPEVLAMQKYLRAAGLYNGPLDEIWGPQSAGALAAYYARR